eukprot:gene43983-58642_t
MIECRICLEPSERKNVIAPCACSGTSRYVHRECLDRWRSTREDRAFRRCTECLQAYELRRPKDNGTASRRIQKLKYACFVAKDLMYLLFITQFVVVVTALVIFSLDNRYGREFLSLCGMTRYPMLFYFLSGTVLDLMVVGLVSSLAYCCGVGSGSGATECVDCCCCPRMPPMYNGYNNQPVCYCCCDTPPTTCCECGGSGGGDCACGHEMLLVFVVGAVVFAVIGVFVSVVLGAILVKEIFERHVHVLRKSSLTQDFVVRDLEEAMTEEEDHDNDNDNENDVEKGRSHGSGNNGTVELGLRLAFGKEYGGTGIGIDCSNGNNVRGEGEDISEDD